MFRRIPKQPAPVVVSNPLDSLVYRWRSTAADLNVASLRLATPPARRALNHAQATVWMEAARQLEAALKEEP